ncbi:hypothetical protein Tsubulata_010670 [Turnera subulata]|uniref:Uncharacterized protein n=1 Tax=Turnera subulata TaxID=218843 RepID=A0A9Q0JKW3_9ROSI|nr:hypothetical protein Tsubulata_010670 [Turnera subulata]
MDTIYGQMQSSQDSNGEAGTSSVDELSLWVDVVGGKKKGRVFGLGGAAGLVGNGSFGGSLPKSSYWEKKFEEQVKKTEVMEERLMKMEELIRSLQIPPGFQQREVRIRRLLKKTLMSLLVKMRVVRMMRLEKL